MNFALFFLACVFLQSVHSLKHPQELSLPKQCEDILPVKTCKRLENAAVRLVLTSAAVTAGIGEAIYAAKVKVEDIIEYVEEYLVQKAINFKCESVMNPEKCTGLDIIGNRLAIGAADVTLTIRMVVVKGIIASQKIYDRTLIKFNELSKNVSCETILSAETCKSIVNVAINLRMKAEDATNAVKQAVIDGASSVQAIYVKAVAYLKEQFKCENILKKSTCDRIRSIADRTRVSLKELNQYVATILAKGITETADIISNVMQFVMEKWSGIFGDEVNYDEYTNIQSHLYTMMADL